MSRPFGSRNSHPRRDLKAIPRSLADFPPPTPQSTECRLWQWHCLPNGYGTKWDADRQKMVLVHRWVWEQINGPTELDILHKCDNPPCYRYEHLFAGTAVDNARDMVAKGRGKGQFQKGNSVRRDSVHRAWLADYSVHQPSDLYDPRINAVVAYALYEQAGWGPWQT